MANQNYQDANIQTNYQENQETSEEIRPLKGYKQYYQNFQSDQAQFTSQEQDLPITRYKQQQNNTQVSNNQQQEDLPLKGYKQQYNNNQVCNDQNQEDLPLKGYKQQQKKTYSDKSQYYQAEQVISQYCKSESIRHKNYHQYQNYENQGYCSDQYYCFNQNSEQQNRQQYHQGDNQRRGNNNKQNNQNYQQHNKNNFREQMPQLNKNICYNFQTQFLRATNYYDINELRANFKALRELNNNHYPSQNSYFILIRPKNGFYNIHKAIKYGVWCSTKIVNYELSSLFNQKDKSVYLIFFPLGVKSKLIGIAQMISDYDPNQSYKYWDNDGIYKGSFELIWHSIKYVEPEFIQQLPYKVGMGQIKSYNIDELRDGTQIDYWDALEIFKIFNQAPEIPSVFEHFNVLDIQEDHVRSNKQRNQEKQEIQKQQKGFKKKYQY